MKMAVIDLTKEFPEDDIITLKACGKVYEIPLVITSDAGDTLIENIETIQKILPAEGSLMPHFNRESLQLARVVLADIAHDHYPEIDAEWIRKNISVPRLILTVYHMIRPIYDFMIGSGFLAGMKKD
jgi:hypothetical protein